MDAAPGTENSPGKLATFLLDRSSRQSELGCRIIIAPPDKYTLPFGRQPIAHILGPAIETVVRQLTKLTKACLIALPERREVIILDHDGLRTQTDA